MGNELFCKTGTVVAETNMYLSNGDSVRSNNPDYYINHHLVVERLGTGLTPSKLTKFSMDTSAESQETTDVFFQEGPSCVVYSLINGVSKLGIDIPYEILGSKVKELNDRGRGMDGEDLKALIKKAFPDLLDFEDIRFSEQIDDSEYYDLAGIDPNLDELDREWLFYDNDLFSKEYRLQIQARVRARKVAEKIMECITDESFLMVSVGPLDNYSLVRQPWNGRMDPKHKISFVGYRVSEEGYFDVGVIDSGSFIGAKWVPLETFLPSLFTGLKVSKKVREA